MQGMTTGPSQIQPVTQRGRDQQNTDWTSMHQRTSQEGGQSRGRAGQGENRPRGVNPEHKTTKQNQASKGNNSRQQTHGQRKPRQHNQKPNNKEKDHSSPAKRGQPERAESSKPDNADTNTTPRETKQTRRTTKARGQKVERQTGDQSKHEKRKQIKYRCTCPVCGQTREYKGGQDQNMKREDQARAEEVLSSLRVCL